MADRLITNARILTLSRPDLGDTPRRGGDLRALAAIERGWVSVRGGAIAGVGEGEPPANETQAGQDGGASGEIETIDAEGRVLLPAYVDCHTHACWAGDRFDEFSRKLAGESYLDILKSGGGIMATVRAVREATCEHLAGRLSHHLWRMSALGTGSVEVKTGYGLNTGAELKMLDAIESVAAISSMLIRPTFLGAHAIDGENPNFIEETINETLPAIAERRSGIVCDAYCEQGAWSFDDTKRLFERARDLGCPIRVHADQFNSLGMTPLAVEMGAISVDHLEATTDADLKRLAESDTFGVVLPASGFTVDDRYAPARRFIDLGGTIAIATNYNPGSAPSPSMPFTISLACRRLQMTVEEAITASTWNAACVLGLQKQVGAISAGRRADLQLLDCRDERELGYEFAGAGPRMLMIGGAVVHRR